MSNSGQIKMQDGTIYSTTEYADVDDLHERLQFEVMVGNPVDRISEDGIQIGIQSYRTPEELNEFLGA